MTVSELIEHLNKLDRKELSEVRFFVGNRKYKIDSIGQFRIITDVNIHLKPTKP
jgi:hypothetical protein